MLTSSEQPLTKAADTNADKVQREVVAKCPESSKPPLNSSVNVERHRPFRRDALGNSSYCQYILYKYYRSSKEPMHQYTDMSQIRTVAF